MSTTDSPSESTEQQADQTLTNGAEEFLERLPLVPDCYIDVLGRVSVSKSIDLRENGDVRKDDTFSRPAWETLEVEEYYCVECGEDLGTESAAIDHLKSQHRQMRKRHGVQPLFDHFGEEDLEFCKATTVTINGIEVEVKGTRWKSIAKVQGDTTLFIENARRTYSLPPNYQFESWEPFAQGRLRLGESTTRLRKSALEKAIKYLSQGRGRDYDSEFFRLYDLGNFPFLLTAHGNALLIAPVKKER